MKRAVAALIAAAVVIMSAPGAQAADSTIGWGWVSTDHTFQQPTIVRVALTDGTRIGKAECYGQGCTPTRAKRIRNLGNDATVVITRGNRTWPGTANKTFVKIEKPRPAYTFAGIEVRES